jgi:transmembrane sensor
MREEGRVTPATDLSSGSRLDQAGGWFLRAVGGGLTAGEQEEFAAWLKADEENPRAFEDAIRVWEAAGQTDSSPELIVLRSAALESLRRANRMRWTRGLWYRNRPLAVAAAALVLGIASLWLAHLFHMPRIYESGVGERRTFILADGSKISLDAQTRIDVRYSPDRRELRLERGRAKFDVAKDPLRPFAVAAADKIVVATGTEFSVELLREQVHVILYEGRVAVLSEPLHAAPPQPLRLASKQGAPDQVLTPGHELVARVAAPTAEITPADTARSLSWEAGQLVFDDESLASAVERVNRYSQDKLRIGDAKAGETLISGVFSAGDTAAFVEGVTGVFPVKLREVGGRKQFVSR